MRGRVRATPVAWLSLLVLMAFAAPAHAAGGLEILPDPIKLGVMLLLFIVLIYPVNRLLVQPMLSVLDEREKQIDGARERAEQVGQQAETVLSSYQESVDAARRSAEQERQSTLEQARGTQLETVASGRAAAEAEFERARNEIDRSLEEARGSLRTQSESLARDAVERILGRSLS